VFGAWVGTTASPDLRSLLPFCIVVVLWFGSCSPVIADNYLCDGDLLTAERTNLGQDAIGIVLAPIPNSADGTVPGDGILLHWRDISLQLPRTNNAGAPSYTDGRWWWRVEDPEHPEFRERKGTIETYRCEPQVFGASPLISKNS